MELKEGYKIFIDTSWVWSLTLGSTVFNFGYALFLVLGPDVSLRDYHGAVSWGLVLSFSAIGGLLGGLAATSVRLRKPMLLALALSTVAGVAPILMSFGRNVIVVSAVAAVGEVGIFLVNNILSTSMQEQLPEDALSRVMAYDAFGSLVSYPVGLPLAAVRDLSLGLRTSLVVSGVIQFASFALLLPMRSVRNLRVMSDGLNEAR